LAKKVPPSVRFRIVAILSEIWTFEQLAEKLDSATALDQGTTSVVPKEAEIKGASESV
jgi:hypothetical protein